QRNNPHLRRDIIKAGNLLKQFNTAEYHDNVAKLQILKNLLGSFEEGLVIEHNFHCDLGYNIHVGKNFYAGYNCTILDMAEVKIGDNCLIGPNVGLYTAGHAVNPLDRHKSGFARPIRIENNVWIGGHCAILGGITIGKNAIIAAGAVVIKDVQENTIVGGNPATKIKDIPT
ncbi:MAG: sugar O-acetyltransferase, partial [Bacteroidota bacterium]